MGMADLRKLQNDQLWNFFLREAYQKTEKEHSSSKWSWLKTRTRSGNKAETANNVAQQAAGWGGAALSTAGAVGVGVLAAGTGGALVIALPALVALGGLGYWGYNKSEHNKVNAEIWKYYSDHRAQNDELAVDAVARPTRNEAMKWLGWFGDEGISNMNHLEEKLKEAMTRYSFSFNTLVQKRNTLAEKIRVWAATPASPAKETQKQALVKEADNLATEYMSLAKHLMYVWYRLERSFMYYEMLDLTVRRLREEMALELTNMRIRATNFYNDSYGGYERLWSALNDLPLPPK